MSEEDVRGGLREAVGDEPPLNFDPDALVVSARRQVTRRRALIAVGVATAAVVVAAVAVPVALGRTPTTPVADQPAPITTTVSSKPEQWPPAGVDPVQYSVADLRFLGDKMRGVLQERVPALLADATEFEFGQFGGEAEGQYYEGQTEVGTHVSFTVDGSRYSLYVQVVAPGVPGFGPAAACADGEGYCKEVGARDGGRLVAKTIDLGDQNLTTVSHFRTTGTRVDVTAYNYDMAGRTVPKYLPTIPVTVEQLIELAADRGLTL